MKVYPKNCFDRFGDDLTELILQYLTFEDKLRLECVSKQWRRLVYNKQYVLEIVEEWQQSKNSLMKLYRKFKRRLPSINSRALKSVLKKCPNIKTIRINKEYDSSVLSLIGRYCNRITSLTLSHISTDDKTLDFFRMYGHKLEELYLLNQQYNENSERIMKFCPNVKSAYIHVNSVEYYLDKEFLPKLEHIKSESFILPQVVNNLKILSDKYSQTIKTLMINPINEVEVEVKTYMEYISRFENLTELKLWIYSDDIEEPIDDCLSLIGQKCNKLLKLDLYFNQTVPISDQFFARFSEFQAIEKLKIIISSETVLSGSVECFKHCKQLKHLEITYSELTEDFFANIASFVPKLRFLKFETKNLFSINFIQSFYSMKNIQRVNHKIIDKTQTNWYFGKCLSEVMSSPKRYEVYLINYGRVGYVINSFDCLLAL